MALMPSAGVEPNQLRVESTLLFQQPPLDFTPFPAVMGVNYLCLLGKSWDTAWILDSVSAMGLFKAFCTRVYI